MRVQVGLCVKIISRKFRLEDELKLGPLILDVFQPIKEPKLKFSIRLKNIHLRHDASGQPGIKRETGIFGQSMGNYRRQELDTEITNGMEIMKLDETLITFDVSLKNNWDDNKLYFFDIYIKLGSLSFNFLPDSIKQLLINLALYKKLFIGSSNQSKIDEEKKMIRGWLSDLKGSNNLSQGRKVEILRRDRKVLRNEYSYLFEKSKSNLQLIYRAG